MNDDHIPVPAGHAPRVETHSHPNLEEVTVAEVGTRTAWISMDKESTVPVRE